MLNRDKHLLLCLFACLLSSCTLRKNQIWPALSLYPSDRFGVVFPSRKDDSEYGEHIAEAVIQNKRRQARIVSWAADVLWIHRASDGKAYLLVEPTFSVPFDNAWLARVNTLGPVWWVQEWIIPRESKEMLPVEPAH